MNKNTSIILTLFTLILLGLSYFASSQADNRQLENIRSVILFDTEIIQKRHKSIPYTVTEGVFFDKLSNRTFKTSIDNVMYEAFLKGNKKSIDMQRSLSLDVVESTRYIGSGYRIISALLFLVALLFVFHGFIINRKLTPQSS